MNIKNIKDKLLRIKISDYPNKVNYINISPTFTWMTEPIFITTKQCTVNDTCRELSAANFRDRVKKINNKLLINKISTKKLRLLLTVRCNCTISKKRFNANVSKDMKWVLEAVRVLNVFEKYMGWSLTEIREVKKRILIRKRQRMYLFTGPNKWLKSSPLISLYTLIIRSAEQKGMYKEFKDVSDYKQIKFGKGTMTGDIKNVHNSYEKWKLILDNYDYLFDYRSVTESSEFINGFQGISFMAKDSMFDSWTDKELRDRWRNVKNAEKEKQRKIN